MSATLALDAAVGPLHGGKIAQRWSALLARVWVNRLDLELASGADPWSSTQLMFRAARIGSLGERRKLAAILAGLVEVARAQRVVLLARVPIRNWLVLDHADELVLLAERLRDLEPVDVGVLAQLALLLRDGRGPVYTGGRPPDELTRVIVGALQVVYVP